MCYTLKITYTELLKQPMWWVSDMIDLISTKSEVEKKESDKQKAMSKGKQRKPRR